MLDNCYFIKRQTRYFSILSIYNTTFSISCINAVQNRGMRFFLGTGKYTPTAAVFGEMAWESPIVKQWKCISSQWARLVNMNMERLNKRIFKWCNAKSNRSCRNWNFRVKEQFNAYGLSQFCNITIQIPRSFSSNLSDKMMHKFTEDWSSTLDIQIQVGGETVVISF